MAQNWEDLGDGQHKLTITDDQGRVPPVTVYGTKDQIITKLSDSKINGDRRIAELKGSNLTAGDRMQIVTDLQNPAKAPEAITKVVESIVGPATEFQRDRSEDRLEREKAAAVQAAKTFAESTPGWFPSEHNKRTLTEYMKRLGLSHSQTAHYTKAFNELTAAKLLQLPPDTEDGEIEGETQTPSPAPKAERTAPAPATPPQTPARYSTGVRSSDISGVQSRPVNRLKYTREQIANMSTKMYREKMSDPEFVRAVEFYNQPRSRRAS